MESTEEVTPVPNGTDYSHSLQAKVAQTDQVSPYLKFPDVSWWFGDFWPFTLQILRRAFQDFLPDRVFLSFNGGKDCTVLLHMVIKFLEREGISLSDLHCWYFQPDDPFAEVEEFVIFCENYYSIEIKRVRGTIREALGKICNVEGSGKDAFEACFMGSRRTDPFCSNLDHFQVRRETF